MSRLLFWKKPAPARTRRGPAASSPGAGRPDPTAERRRLLLDHFSEPILLAHSLLEGQDLGDSIDARRAVLGMLERTSSEAAAAGFGTAQVESARFAVVAFLDEAVLTSKWRSRDAWLGNPLQRELFKINIAGEEFFNRLEKLRQSLAENRPVVEVYYACLAMGFEGRFKVLGRERLEALLRELAAELSPEGARKMASLSPAWAPPDEFPEVAGEGVPIWLSIVAFVGSVILIVALFAAAARFSADSEARTIREYYLQVVTTGGERR